MINSHIRLKVGLTKRVDFCFSLLFAAVRFRLLNPKRAVSIAAWLCGRKWVLTFKQIA